MELFKDDWGIDQSQQDDTKITSTILYFSEDELAEFKILCKKGMKKEYGEKVMEKGNLSDFLLLILNDKYGNI